MIVAAGILALAGFVVINRQQQAAARDQAVKTAQAVVAQMLATRSVYTRDVVANLKGDGVDVSFGVEFNDNDKQAPLPATLVHNISEIVNAQGLYAVDLISPWPINPNKAPRQGWESDAITRMIDNPEQDLSTVESLSDGRSLRFVSADFASVDSCVSCHNTHPDSPKTDFQLGDMMGALVVRVPIEDELSAASSSAMWIALGLLAGISGVIAVIWIMMRRIVLNPISEVRVVAQGVSSRALPALVQSMKATAEGDLTQRFDPDVQKVAVASDDEIGQISQSFNEIIDGLDTTADEFEGMRVGMSSLVGEVTDTVESLGRASTELAEAAKQAGDATDGIAETAQHIAKGSQEQAISVEKASTASGTLASNVVRITEGAERQSESAREANELVKSMSEAAAAVTKTAGSATEQAKVATDAAENGMLVVTETVSGMHSINDAVGVVSKYVEELGDQSAEIGKIVSVIDDIAAQTNLLALNAAIEAARAGEQGRGFAVVADEVRQLAERVIEATSEIGDLIERVQSGVAKSVEASASGAEQVSEGTHKAEAAGEALQAIKRSVEAVAAEIVNISETANQVGANSGQVTTTIEAVNSISSENSEIAGEINAATDRVKETIETVASVTEESSAAAEQASASTEQMSAQVQSVVQSANDLAGIANKLRSAVSAFKTDGAVTEASAQSSPNDGAAEAA